MLLGEERGEEVGILIGDFYGLGLRWEGSLGCV